MWGGSMVDARIQCPACGGDHVQRYGKQGDIQRYRCTQAPCGRVFLSLAAYRYKGARPAVSQRIQAMAANGAGIRAIARALEISTHTVMRAESHQEPRTAHGDISMDGFTLVSTNLDHTLGWTGKLHHEDGC